MRQGINFSKLNRRDFFSKIVPAGAFTCFGYRNIILPQVAYEKDINLQEKTGFTYEQLFNFTFVNTYIPVIKDLEKEIGKEELYDLIKKTRAETYSNNIKRNSRDIQDRSAASFVEFFWVPITKSNFYKNCIKISTIEKDSDPCRVVMTDCMYAKAFRRAEAGDLGYATYCNADFAMARAFNPKLKLDRKEKFVRAIERYWESTLIRDLMELKGEEISKRTYVSEEEIMAHYKKMKKFDGTLSPLSELQNQITKELREEKKTRMLEEWINDLRTKASIEIDQDLL